MYPASGSTESRGDLTFFNRVRLLPMCTRLHSSSRSSPATSGHARDEIGISTPPLLPDPKKSVPAVMVSAPIARVCVLAHETEIQAGPRQHGPDSHTHPLAATNGIVRSHPCIECDRVAHAVFRFHMTDGVKASYVLPQAGVRIIVDSFPYSGGSPEARVGRARPEIHPRRSLDHATNTTMVAIGIHLYNSRF